VVGGAPAVVHLHRSVVRVAHVHRADYRRCWRVLESLVSQKTRWVLSVCHCLNCEIGLKLAKVWGSLVHYGVEIVLGIVVISHKIWAHVSVQLKIGALMLGAFPAPKALPDNRFQNILVCLGLVGLVVFCVFEQDLVHIGAGVLEQLVVRVEDDDRNLAVAEHGQLVRLLHQTELSLCEGHLSIPLVRDSLDRDLFPTHSAAGCLSWLLQSVEPARSGVRRRSLVATSFFSSSPSRSSSRTSAGEVGEERDASRPGFNLTLAAF